MAGSPTKGSLTLAAAALNPPAPTPRLGGTQRCGSRASTPAHAGREGGQALAGLVGEGQGTVACCLVYWLEGDRKDHAGAHLQLPLLPWHSCFGFESFCQWHHQISRWRQGYTTKLQQGKPCTSKQAHSPAAAPPDLPALAGCPRRLLLPCCCQAARGLQRYQSPDAVPHEHMRAGPPVRYSGVW